MRAFVYFCVCVQVRSRVLPVSCVCVLKPEKSTRRRRIVGVSSRWLWLCIEHNIITHTSTKPVRPYAHIYIMYMCYMLTCIDDHHHHHRVRVCVFVCSALVCFENDDDDDDTETHIFIHRFVVGVFRVGVCVRVFLSAPTDGRCRCRRCRAVL